MAEGYLSKRLRDGGKNISVASAGTGAISGLKPSPEAVEAMKEINIDVSRYESSPLTKDTIEKADIILVMGPMHKERVLQLAPSVEDKVFYLRQFVNGNAQDKFIPDPIGKPIEFYRKTLDLIKESVEGFLKWLEK